MRFRHDLTGKNTVKRVVSFLLMLCLLVPMLPSSIGLDAKADNDTTEETTTGANTDTVTITLHDLYIDRKEALPDDTRLSNCLDAYLHARFIQVKKGTKLSDALTEHEVELGTSSLKDTGVYKTGTEDKNAMTSVIDASKCVWYTRDGGKNGGVDGNNARTKYGDWAQSIDQDIDLYTYSYRIRLITGESQYKDLIVREGQKEGFVYGDTNRTSVNIEKFLTDNKVATSWTDVNEGTTTTDLSALTNGITRNYAFRANGVTPNTVEIPCKVAVNGQWTDAGTIKMDKDRVDVWGKTGPALNYYVTDDELLNVYQSYGFAKNMLQTGEISTQINGYFPFRNGNGNNDTLHIRQMPKQVEGGTEFRVPLIEDTTEIASGGLAVYYTPHNTTKYTSNFLAYGENDGQHRNRYGWASASDAAVLKDNSFYTVDAPDPQRQYVLSGETVTVKGDSSSKAVKWAPISGYPDDYSKSTGRYFASEADGVTNDNGTFKIENIHQPIVITTDITGVKTPGKMKVRCFVLQNETWQQAGDISVDNSRWDVSWGNDTEKNNKIEVGTRVYITPKELESVYSKYGFKSSEYDGGLYFPHTDKGGSTIWLDQKPVRDQTDGYHIPVLQRDKTDVDVYYIPNNKDGTKSYFNGGWPNGVDQRSKSKNDEQLRLDNTFYSVDVKDEAGTLDSFTSPDTQYFLTGTDATVTVPSANWFAKDPFGLAVDLEQSSASDGKETITIKKIDSAVTITTKEVDATEIIVHAFVSMNGEWRSIETGTISNTQISDSQYYITADLLNKLFGSCGFSADGMTAEQLKNQFASATLRGGDGTIQQVGAEQTDKIKTSVTKEQGKYGIALYYTPKKTEESFSKTDSDMLKANAFYSVEVKDPQNSFKGEELPDKQYFLTGSSVTIDVPAKSGATWYTTDDSGNPLILNEKTSGNKTTVSISSLDRSIIITTQAPAGVTVKAYVAVDGKWQNIQTTVLDAKQREKFNSNSAYKFYFTLEQLETLYKEWGFSASTYKDDASPFPRIFANNFATDKETADIWADADAKYINGNWLVPAIETQNQSKGVALYYLPNNVDGKEGYFKTSASRKTASSNNTFYSIKIEDEAKQFPGVTMPDTQYVLTGENKKITLPYRKGVSWYQGAAELVVDTNSIDIAKGTATYTVMPVTEPTTISTQRTGEVVDGVEVKGYVSKGGKWTEVSTTNIPEKQATGTDTENSRYYVTSAQLEKLFGSYGFQASDYASITDAGELSKHFPHSTIRGTGNTNNDSQVWTNAEGTAGDSWQVNTIQLKYKSYGIAIYYVPKTDGIGDSFAKTDATVLAKNRFYSISVKDEGKKFDDTGVSLPTSMYCLAGDTTISLPYVNGVKWTLWSTATNDGKASAINSTQTVDGDTAKLSFCARSNLTATTQENANENHIKLEAYISIDNTWSCIKETSISKANWDSKAGKFYITEQELKDIYQQYGFNGLQADIYSFGITTKYKDSNKNDDNTANMWPDQKLTEDSAGNKYLPLITADFITKPTEENIIKIYYLPRNEQEASKNKYTNVDNTTYKKGVPISASSNFSAGDAAAVAQDNTFYSVTFQDPDGKLGDAALPDTAYILKGASQNVEMPYVEGVTWQVVDSIGIPRTDLTPTQTGDKMTLTVSNANEPLTVTTNSKSTLAKNVVALNAYVAIDDEWVPVYDEWTGTSGSLTGGTLTINQSQISNYRYYLTDAQLERIYGAYGFKAENWDHINHFPHTSIINPNDTNIWADQTPFQMGNTWCVPLLSTGGRSNGIAVYYTPNYTPNADKEQDRWEKTDTNCLKANSVQYTVSEEDPNELLTEDQKNQLPAATRYNREEKVQIHLPTLGADEQWIAVDGKTHAQLENTDDNYTVKTDENGTTTATIKSLTQKVTWIPVRIPSVSVRYDVGLKQSDWQDLGTTFPTTTRTTTKSDGTTETKNAVPQTVTQDGMIRGKTTTYIDYAQSGTTAYKVLQPDYDYAKVRVSILEDNPLRDEPRDFYYTFKGWHIVKAGEDNNSLSVDILPGQEQKLDLTKYGSTVVLKAVWKAQDEQKRPNTVNFYLSTACEIMDNMGNGFAGQAKENFTTTIYSTRIFGTDDLETNKSTAQISDSGDFQILAPATNESTAYQTDSTLREAVNKPITKDITDAIASGCNSQLKLESFPSDEEILNELRNRVDDKTITIGDTPIPRSYLTTEYFAVRWYVLKYHNSDAWHIDGVLVAKQAHAVITKTFAGDADAIAAVKNNYQINVTHDGGTQQDYVLTLHPAAEEEHADHFGYTSYDAKTNTYTWVLTGRQGRKYTAKEVSYATPNEKQYHGTYQYRIKNSENSDTPDWTDYSPDTGVSLVAQAYADDAPTESYQTVSFRNIYTPVGSISLSKIDATTGFGLTGVEFTITKQGETSPMTLYQKMETENEKTVATSFYQYYSEGKYTNAVNKVTTDVNGMLYVKLEAGTYTLTETKPPTGYDGPETITIIVDQNGKITGHTETHDSALQLKSTSDDWVIVSGENKATLTIKNTSKILLTVTAKKKWLDADTTNWKPVKVSLYRNGVKMAGYTEELNAENSWSYTWQNLPLYVDDRIAKYSLQEDKIGDTEYDPSNGSNGYRDYLVEYEPTKYLEQLNDKNDPLTTDWKNAQTNATWKDGTGTHYARHALLVVKNSTAQSDIIFKKTDSLGKDLAGAVFGIYADEACTDLVSKSESDAQGYVRFTSKSGEAHYAYIKEIQAPSGCTLNDTVYRVTIPENHQNGRTDDIIFEKQVIGSDGKFTYVTTEKTTDSDEEYTVAQNSSHINLQIKKVDNNGKPLPGAEFEIKKFNTETKEYEPFGTNDGIYSVTDKDTGIVQITGNDNNPLTFPEGKYKITETETPSNLYRNAGQIIVTVQSGKVSYDRASGDTETDIKSWNMERKPGTVTYILQVTNTPWWALPSTGGSGILLPILFGTALMGGASALALWLRKRRKNG